MIPRLYRVYQPRDVTQVMRDVEARLRIADGCEVYVTKIGGGSEWQAFCRRYYKLLGLIAEHVPADGGRFTVARWDLELKARFLPFEEIRLLSGKIVYQLPRKRDMDRDLRETYLASCKEFAAEHGLFLQHPEEEPA